MSGRKITDRISSRDGERERGIIPLPLQRCAVTFPLPFASLSFPTLRALLHSPPLATSPRPFPSFRSVMNPVCRTPPPSLSGRGGGGERFPVLTVRPDTYTFIPNHSVRIGNCAPRYTLHVNHTVLFGATSRPPPRHWPTRAVISHFSSYLVALPLSPPPPPPSPLPPTSAHPSTACYIRSARALPDVP